MALEDYLDDSTDDVGVLDPRQAKYNFGPAVEEYYQRSKAFFEREALVKNFLFKQQIISCSDNDSVRNMRFIPGSTFSGRIGPTSDCTVMFVGRIAQGVAVQPRGRSDEQPPQFEDLFKPIDFLLGDSFDVLVNAFDELGISPEIWRQFYMTNMVRFPRPTATNKGSIRKAWVKESLPFLEQELRIIKPKFIFCMGTEASTFFTGYSITKAQSHVFDYKLFDGSVAKVVCGIDPKSVIDNFEKRPQFMAALRLFTDQVLGRKTAEHENRHRFIDNIEDLTQLVDKLLADNVSTFAIDCEWGGQHFLDDGAALRTIQLGWSGCDAMVVILRRAGMGKAFVPYISDALCQLRRLICRPGVKLLGHNMLSDFPWLYDLGIDITPYMYFDTMLASHLFEPTASHVLEDLTVKFVPGWPRHDMDLLEWKKNSGEFNEDDGYGKVPDEILHPYSAYDVCAVMMLYEHYRHELDKHGNESLRGLFYRILMPALPAFAEIQSTGVYMDLERLEETRQIYQYKRDELLDQFRIIIGDPSFNPNSSAQKSDLLFNRLKLTPIKATGKYPMMWEDVMARNEEHLHDPASDGETLDILAHKSGEARMLRNICLLTTVLQNFLTEPVLNEKTGCMEITKGLAAVKSTGRLYTSIGQMIKTGRLSSSDPNLMNLPNKQEAPIEEVLGSDQYKLRACFMATPGSMLIISDYMQAEIAALAYLSGDETLIAAVEAGEDIHSVVGRKMFNKEHLSNKEFKKQFKHLRVAAKSIVFGLLYGRGPIAIAREVEKAGVECSVDDATKFVSDFMQQFPLVAQLIDKTHEQVVKNGWVENIWGRREYFYTVGVKDNSKIEARQKRMGFNFLIQGYVAELLRQALINFRKYRLDNPGVLYKLILTVHDSIILEAPIKHVEHVSEIVIPECMTRQAKAPKLGFTVGTDTDVSIRWDEKLSLAEFLELGFSEEYAKKYCKKNENGEPI